MVLGYSEAELCMRGSGYHFIHAADMMYCADNHLRSQSTTRDGRFLKMSPTVDRCLVQSISFLGGNLEPCFLNYRLMHMWVYRWTRLTVFCFVSSDENRRQWFQRLQAPDQNRNVGLGPGQCPAGLQRRETRLHRGPAASPDVSVPELTAGGGFLCLVF